MCTISAFQVMFIYSVLYRVSPSWFVLNAALNSYFKDTIFPVSAHQTSGEAPGVLHPSVLIASVE